MVKAHCPGPIHPVAEKGTDHASIVELGDPPRFIFIYNLASFYFYISLPKGATLEDPEAVQKAIDKLYKRAKFYLKTISN
jgi:hypothetical protein